MINKKFICRRNLHSVTWQSQRFSGQRGFAIVAILLMLMIVGIMAVGSINLSHLSGESAHTAIQRGRAIQAADGGSTVAERELLANLGKRLFADDQASEGIYTRGTIEDNWWRQETYIGQHELTANEVIGVIVPPRYVVEEFGRFVSDGGSGIASLDVGGGAYGRGSRTGRDIVVYRVESQGKGSLGSRQSVVEVVMAFSY